MSKIWKSSKSNIIILFRYIVIKNQLKGWKSLLWNQEMGQGSQGSGIFHLENVDIFDSLCVGLTLKNKNKISSIWLKSSIMLIIYYYYYDKKDDSFSYHYYIHARENNVSSIINATWSFTNTLFTILRIFGHA